MNKKTKDSLIIGFALFSMFFGAGNLIFPGFLGLQVGDQYLPAILGFTIAGIGLPILAILACSKGDGTYQTLASYVGKRFAIFSTIVLFLAIGPMLAIPRTAATTYEVFLSQVIPGVSPIILMAAYFILNLIFVLKRSSIIDALGKYLTPALVAILFFIIAKGIIFPIGEITSTGVTAVFTSSLLEGYQTMDAIAGLLFASLITTSLKSKGYKNKDMLPMVLKSSLVVIIGLTFVYGGLTYIGAQTVNIAPEGVNNTSQLLFIAKSILGNLGTTLIGLAMALACLTTSIGLISTGAEFFDKISNSKLSYKFNAIAISLISFFIACLGVDKIITISVPVLNILYPITITMIFMGLTKERLNSPFAFRCAIYSSLTLGLLLQIAPSKLSFLPFSNFGFGWVVPTLIIFIIAYVYDKNYSNVNILSSDM